MSDAGGKVSALELTEEASRLQGDATKQTTPQCKRDEPSLHRRDHLRSPGVFSVQPPAGVVRQRELHDEQSEPSNAHGDQVREAVHDEIVTTKRRTSSSKRQASETRKSKQKDPPSCRSLASTFGEIRRCFCSVLHRRVHS